MRLSSASTGLVRRSLRVSPRASSSAAAAAPAAAPGSTAASAAASLAAASSSATASAGRAATAAWLARGGDGRVTLHAEDSAVPLDSAADVGAPRRSAAPADGVNSYGTTTRPRAGCIERSSCTSSSPKEEAFLAADAAREALGPGLDAEPMGADCAAKVAALVNSNRKRLLDVLGLDGMGVACVMCASGTDAEMIGALCGLAAARARAPPEGARAGAAVASRAAVLSLLMPGTGSGVGDAAGLRHHSAAAPGAAAVQPGEPLDGVADGSVVAAEPAKDGVDLHDLAQLEAYIELRQTAAAGDDGAQRPHVVPSRAGDFLETRKRVLHAVAGSKTGLHHPPLAVVDALAKRSDVTVLVDACQLRVNRGYVAQQLAKGYVVLVTGSKFFGGPPFAGAALLPREIADAVDFLPFLSGLGAYFTRDDAPAVAMPKLAAALPAQPNAGLALRWAAALENMERFHALPERWTDRFASRWVARVRAIAEGFYPAVEVLDVGSAGSIEAESRVGGANTVVSLMVRRDGAQLLGVRALKQLQVLLAADLSDLCGTALPASARSTAATRCQVGQPVVLGGGASYGVVRIALGAPDVCAAVERAVARGGPEPAAGAVEDALDAALDALVVDDIQILRKVELIATHFSALEQAYDALPASVQRWRATQSSQGVSLHARRSASKKRTVENVDINWLKPHEKVVNQARVDALIDAIARWGAYRKPLLVDRDSGSILDGHHRYFAAQGLGLARVPAALVDYVNDESITVDVWPGDHGVETISKRDVIAMCLSPDVYPPKTSRHTFREPLDPIFVPLEELR